MPDLANQGVHNQPLVVGPICNGLRDRGHFLPVGIGQPESRGFEQQLLGRRLACHLLGASDCLAYAFRSARRETRSDSPDDSTDGIAVANGIGQPFKHDDRHALTRKATVCVRIERCGRSLVGQVAHLGDALKREEAHRAVSRRANHHVAGTVLDCVDAGRDGRQR